MTAQDRRENPIARLGVALLCGLGLALAECAHPKSLASEEALAPNATR